MKGIAGVIMCYMANTDADQINVNWVDMKPDIHQMDGVKKIYPSPIPGHYGSLREELLEKCNPKNYSGAFNYNYEKVNIANELYAEILGTDNLSNDFHKLVSIRKRAESGLGIKISTEGLYNFLLEQTNPERFLNPYNKELVSLANELHQQTLLNADNIEELEKIKCLVDRNPDLSKPIEKTTEYDATSTDELATLWVAAVIVTVIILMIMISNL